MKRKHGGTSKDQGDVHVPDKKKKIKKKKIGSIQRLPRVNFAGKLSEVKEKIESYWGKVEFVNSMKKRSKPVGEPIETIGSWKDVLNELVEDIEMKGGDMFVKSGSNLLSKCDPTLDDLIEDGSLVRLCDVLKFVHEKYDLGSRYSSAEDIQRALYLLSTKLGSLGVSLLQLNQDSLAHEQLRRDVWNLRKKLNLFANVCTDPAWKAENASAYHAPLVGVIAEILQIGYDLGGEVLDQQHLMFLSNGAGPSMGFTMMEYVEGSVEKIATSDDDSDDTDNDEACLLRQEFRGKPDVACFRATSQEVILVAEVKTTECLHSSAVHPFQLSDTGSRTNTGEVASDDIQDESSAEIQTETKPSNSSSRSDIITEPKLRDILHVLPSTCSSEHSIRDSKSHSRMEYIQTQHFLQQLAALKSNVVHRNKLEKMFGLYVVMNRVYFTLLCLKPRSDQFMPDNNTDKEAFMTAKVAFISGDAKQEVANASKDVEFRQICSKYLNFFNPEHFKAILAFINFIFANEDEWKFNQ